MMSTSVLIDRMILYTEFLETLSSGVDVRVWAASASNPTYKRIWSASPATVEVFPEVRPFREFPYNYMRRINEFAWDLRQRPSSRLSMMRHIRDNALTSGIRALKLPARLLASFKMETWFENKLERLMLGYGRSKEAVDRLHVDRPSAVLTTGPFQLQQPGVVAAAKNLGIPVLALVPSWDNLSTKNRMVFKYDGFLVWSEQTKKELLHFYPSSRNVPIYVVGAPQFDVFFQDRFYLSREQFCANQGLRPEIPIVLYAVGSPNFLRGERFGAVDFAERVVRGELGDVQVIVRPHPLHYKGEFDELFQRFSPRVILQRPSGDGTALPRSQDEGQIMQWVNTFRHADVVVNLSSTVTVDASVFDRPVVNLNYDPAPGSPQQQLITEINHEWDHFKPIAESGGVWLVNDPDELVGAVKTYLRHPELHRNERRWIAEYVCGYLDGRCGERMAEAVLDFANGQNRVMQDV